jgi:hypothetical protein
MGQPTFITNGIRFPRDRGWLRLFAIPKPNGVKNLLGVPNVILQKLPAPEFTVTSKARFRSFGRGRHRRLGGFGRKLFLRGDQACKHGFAPDQGSAMSPGRLRTRKRVTFPWASNSAFLLRVRVNVGASCEFSYSTRRKTSSPQLGNRSHAQPGRLGRGACRLVLPGATADAKKTGYVDVDWFRLEK